jgi:cardiolipin synthase A/B
MGPLLNAVIELVVLLSPARIEAIAARIRGIVYSDRVEGDLYQIVGTPAARFALDSLMTAWKDARSTRGLRGAGSCAYR